MLNFCYNISWKGMVEPNNTKLMKLEQSFQKTNS